MKFTFHSEARAELNDAADFYEACQPGLGLEFAEEVYATIQRVCRYPTAWSPLSANTRRCLTTRFPFGVIYQVRDEGVLIVPVTHLSRKPGYWRKRLR